MKNTQLNLNPEESPQRHCAIKNLHLFKTFEVKLKEKQIRTIHWGPARGEATTCSLTPPISQVLIINSYTIFNTSRRNHI